MVVAKAFEQLFFLDFFIYILYYVPVWCQINIISVYFFVYIVLNVIAKGSN